MSNEKFRDVSSLRTNVIEAYKTAAGSVRVFTDGAQPSFEDIRQLRDWLTDALGDAQQPVAYIRGHKIGTHIEGVLDYDEEIVSAANGKPTGEGWTPLYAVVPADFARDLEREIARLREGLKSALLVLSAIQSRLHGVDPNFDKDVRFALDAARAALAAQEKT